MTWFARLCGTLLLILSGGAMADETRGTAEEAQALVARAIAAYDAEGDAAFAAMDLPPELRSIAVLWDDSLLKSWYAAVEEHR